MNTAQVKMLKLRTDRKRIFGMFYNLLVPPVALHVQYKCTADSDPDVSVRADVDKSP